MSSTLTNLTAATTWSGTDLFYALVGGNSRKIAASKFLVAETSSTLAMQDSTTTQAFRVYNTFTDSSNYVRAALQFSSGNLQLAAETAGTGGDDIDLLLTSAGTGKVVISSGTTANARLQVLNTTSTQFLSIADFYAANVSTSGEVYFNFGKANSAGNGVQLLFNYVGDNNAANGLKIYLVGIGSLFSVAKAGTTRVFETIGTPAGGSTDARLLLGSAAFGIYIGSGAPTVSAAQGSIYLRSDGSSSSTRLYVNSTGSTTWVNVTTAS